MKHVIAVLLVLASACAACRGADNELKRELCIDVLREHRPGDIAGEPVCFVSVYGFTTEDYAALGSIDFPFTVKFGRGAEWRDGKLYDPESGLRCTKLTLKIETFSAVEAVVTVAWASTMRAGGGRALRFVRKDDRWLFQAVVARYDV